ncbi:hypothetical protein GOP47_0011777 [Adiantum capillus-veneris]|uniref:Uncharacterized protein n=1 Tax=Adiantum capillus-veneris TaxID=13818 RepID=A0A9D4ZFQ0_ADICA|nr:hypothetical protein GOP47_0011777 [Adiantum capillus-veneris]
MVLLATLKRPCNVLTGASPFALKLLRPCLTLPMRCSLLLQPHHLTSIQPGGFQASSALPCPPHEAQPFATASSFELNTGLQSLSKPQPAATYEDPLGICVPPTRHDAEVLKPPCSVITYPGRLSPQPA